MAAEILADPRTGKNGRHSLIAQLRQSVFGRLAGYEDVNDADRLGRDPAMRWIVGGRAVTEQAASTSQMGRFETGAMTEEPNLSALANLSGHWIDRVQARRGRTALVLDIDSSVSPTYGAQEGTAYNGHFACTCYHPLFVFNQDGDLERCALRAATSTARTAGATRLVLPIVPSRSARGPAPSGTRRASCDQVDRTVDPPRMRLLRPTLALTLLLAASASAQVPTPVVEGPITSPGGAFLPAITIDLASAGYMQEEYFFSGDARAFTNVGPLGEDGLWTVEPSGTTAAYKTRLVVIRPTSRKKFNGTVVMEWLNVSGGVDAGPDLILAHTEFMREGFAWVGVSAQYAGVEGGGGLVSVVELPLKEVNPARYGSLVHPGDTFSYDIYSQAAQAIRQPPAGVTPLGDLALKRVIAAGESQSAFRMVTYVNGIHPITQLFDGYFVHSRGAISAPLSENPQPLVSVPGTARIRADIDVPVLTLETESDLTFLGYFSARQDDAENFRLWEVAGTAHADYYVAGVGMADTGTNPDIVQPVEVASPLPGIIDCATPINSGPQHFVVKAAFAALDKWIRKGKAPKSAPRLEVSAGPPVTIDTDEHGNALGGIRTPYVDAPIATFGGVQVGSGILCMLFGSTHLFDDAKLASLYPSHPAFVKAHNKALKRSVKAGWIVKADAKLMKKWAKDSSVGN